MTHARACLLLSFWFLETIARVPYFAYVSMLHLYETIGWWRAPGLRQVTTHALAHEPSRRPSRAASAVACTTPTRRSLSAQVHAAEEWNELHHLLIMEALGGDARWSDRFLGYHAAVLYYWLLVPTYLVSPAVACAPAVRRAQARTPSLRCCVGSF